MSEFVDNPQAAYAKAGIKGCANHIVWLDYTKPAELRSQLDEFSTLINSSDHYDIIRITLNANYKAIKGEKEGMSRVQKQEARFNWLRHNLGNFLPESAAPADLSDEGYPKLLARMLRIVSGRSARSSSKIIPLSIVTYADGHKMLAATVAVASDAESGEDVRKAAGLENWPLVSQNWDELHDLRIATLTGRERELLDRLLPTVPARKVIQDLKFDLFEDRTREQTAAYLEKYGNLLRFYPNFVSLD
nr:O-methyltransferase [Aurantiacibacter suaedae]